MGGLLDHFPSPPPLQSRCPQLFLTSPREDFWWGCIFAVGQLWGSPRPEKGGTLSRQGRVPLFPSPLKLDQLLCFPPEVWLLSPAKPPELALGLVPVQYSAGRRFHSVSRPVLLTGSGRSVPAGSSSPRAWAAGSLSEPSRAWQEVTRLAARTVLPTHFRSQASPRQRCSLAEVCPQLEDSPGVRRAPVYNLHRNTAEWEFVLPLLEGCPGSGVQPK